MMEAALAAEHRVARLTAVANHVFEAQRMVLHHHQRLRNVVEDAPRHQTALE